jgi:GntR family transcriptional regulator/MocR family aminotransferase
MVQRPVRPPLPSLLLDSTAAMTRFRQLYEGWRHAILAGQFAPGTKLPSTRAVAEYLGVSRNTVYLAFEHLRSEGYVEGRQGAGTYVAQVLPEALLTLPPSASPVSRSRRGIASSPSAAPDCWGRCNSPRGTTARQQRPFVCFRR